MGFFKNVKNLKDKVLEDDILKDLNREELHPVYDAIDKKAENEKIKAQKEREYYEKLNPEQKIEYNRIKKRNHNLKRLGAYGLYGAGTASVLAYLFIVIFNFAVAKKLYKIKYNIIFIFVAIFVLSILAKINAYMPLSWITFIIKSIMIIIIAIFIIYYYRKNNHLRLLLKIIKQK